MKRCILFLLAIASLSVSAGNSLSLPALSGKPNDTLTVSVQFDCTDAVTAIEVALPLSPYIQYVDASATLNATRSNGHALYAQAVRDTLFVQIYNLSLSALQGQSGELFSFRLALRNEPQVLPLQPQVKAVNAQGQCLPVSVVLGKITTLAPKIAIQTPTINYGHHPIRQTYTQNLSVQNIGTSPLTIDSLSLPADDLFAYDGKACTIAAGATADIPIRYTPVRRGSYSGIVKIHSNAVNAALRVNSEVAVIADPFSVNELHVGSASGIADSLATIPLTMNNMEPIVAMQCAFRLPSELVFDAGSFRVNATRTNGHTALSSVHGDTLSLYIYSPTNQPLLSSDGEVASFRLRLNGNSGTYYLTPMDVILSNVTSENMVSSTSDGYVSIRSPRLNCSDRLAFADAPVTDVAHAALSVRNNGDAPLVIERATFLADGYSVVEQLPVSVSPWSETTLTIACQPQAEGDFSTTMNLYTNDPTARLKPIALSGHIYEPNSLSVEGVSRQEDGAYMLSVSLSNYTDIVAAQFDVHWIGTVATSQAQCTPSSRLQQHNCSVTRIGDADYRVLVYSMANTPVSGHDGELLQLLFIPQDVTAVDYCGTTLTIDNIVLSNARGENKQSQSPITYRIKQPRYMTDAITTCDKYVWGNHIYTESGIYMDTLQTILGCDSIVALHITINHSIATEFSATACDTYTWHGKEYTASGNYVDTLQTIHGCDSIITLHLTIHNSIATDTTVIATDSLLWEDTILRKSGDYIYHFTTVHGCDSIITLHLTIHNTPTDLTAHTATPYVVYPNPATDMVYLCGHNIASACIFSSAGSLIYYTRPIERLIEHAIDVSTWATGVYMVVVYDANHTSHTTRFIKAR